MCGAALPRRKLPINCRGYAAGAAAPQIEFEREELEPKGVARNFKDTLRRGVATAAHPAAKPLSGHLIDFARLLLLPSALWLLPNPVS